MNPLAKKVLDKQMSSLANNSVSTVRTNSRNADKFVIRLPDDLRPRCKAAAEETGRSMNMLMVQALRHYLDGQEQQQLLLDALADALARAQLPARGREVANG